MGRTAAPAGGTYLFLTDDGGVGGAHLEPTIGEHDVELPDDLLVRLVDSALSGP